MSLFHRVKKLFSKRTPVGDPEPRAENKSVAPPPAPPVPPGPLLRVPAADTVNECPACHSSDLALVAYGLPVWTQELKNDIQARRVVTGGCMFTADSPRYQCNECTAQIAFLREDHD